MPSGAVVPSPDRHDAARLPEPATTERGTRLTEPGVDLLATALDLGYSSHSHFTETFRRSFGITPSAVRGNLTATRVRETGTKNEGWRHSVRPHAQH
ncbi:MAG: helix-turn-helix domain-containing protein [Acidobacteria bacterium]|nr:helix-turn-helix domain-containing protein [Acidobacteriota bacterium]